MAEKPSRGDKRRDAACGARTSGKKKKKKTQPMIRAGPGCQPETPLLPSSPPVSGGRQRCPAYPPLTMSMCAVCARAHGLSPCEPKPHQPRGP
jgi:hypothetical protein